MVIGLLASALAGSHTAPVTPFLHRPFEGDFPVSGLFDHRKPSGENDHRQVAAWDVVTWGKAGHAAYDWPMREGTPVLAAADGVVILAGDQGPKRCGKGQVPSDVRVQLRHSVAGREIHTGYMHLSKASVAVGDTIVAGTVIGESGNTGCSSGPHLHFAVLERVDGLPHLRSIDPYGWDADRPDPLVPLPYRHAEWMWLPGEAPLLFRTMGRSQHEAWGDVRLTRFRGMGWQDARHPNNEFVQVAVRPNGPKRVKLAGWSLRSRAGESYTFPEDAVVVRGTGTRVYSGVGNDTASTLFWNRETPVWDDVGDCVELIDPRGDVVHVQHFGRRADRWCD